ncbi:TcpE family conjugal transfer membrane protein [Nonomuraea sp. NPDC050783]|uniref:TcpE family conjugal transfer membrane protein n=1 Tax=Nonomuraea sp. NPDC050783 TaxID=3154634 RepID=UPI003465C5B5
MDLPTYTNIWRIEKRLYKLYDLRLPMPLPIVWIGVFVGVFVPWSLLLILVGVPVAMPWHVLFLVPPGIVTWLSTRPVIEGKRLTELLESQIRYLGEPKAWYRLAPGAEPETITFSARVWRTTPARAKARRPAKARQAQRRREAQPVTGPRQVRPAVAAAAAAAAGAAGQAPVAAEPAAGRKGWGTRRGAAAAPALEGRVRQGAPEALPEGSGRRQSHPLTITVGEDTGHGADGHRKGGKRTGGRKLFARDDAVREAATQQAALREAARETLDREPAAGEPTTHDTAREAVREVARETVREAAREIVRETAPDTSGRPALRLGDGHDATRPEPRKAAANGLSDAPEPADQELGAEQRTPERADDAPAAHEQTAHEQTAHEQTAHEQTAHEQIAYEQAPQGRLPQEQVPSGRIPSGRASSGRVPLGQVSSGPDEVRDDQETRDDQEARDDQGVIVPARAVQGRKPAAAKPIDTEALRRLRRLAASADAPADAATRTEAADRAERGRHEDELARDQHRKGQPPRLGTVPGVSGPHRSWPPLDPDAKPLPRQPAPRPASEATGAPARSPADDRSTPAPPPVTETGSGAGAGTGAGSGTGTETEAGGGVTPATATDAPRSVRSAAASGPLDPGHVPSPEEPLSDERPAGPASNGPRSGNVASDPAGDVPADGVAVGEGGAPDDGHEQEDQQQVAATGDAGSTERGRPGTARPHLTAVPSDAPATRSDAPATRSDDGATRSDDGATRSDDGATRPHGAATRPHGPEAQSEDATLPSNEGAAPSSEGVVPSGDDVAQSGKGRGLAGEGVVPSTKGATLPSTEGATLPSTEGVAPSTEGVAPATEGVAPADEGGVLAGEGVASSGEGVASSDDDVASSDDDAASSGGSVASSGGGAASSGGGSASSDGGVVRPGWPARPAQPAGPVQPVGPVQPAASAQGVPSLKGEGLGRAGELVAPVPGPRPGEGRVRRVESVVGRDSGGWRRIAQVVVGGSGVRTDGSEIDEARARAVFSGGRRVLVLGCTGGAGQSTTALMLGHTLAQYRDDRVVAVDANTGGSTLTSKIEPETPETLTSLLSGLDRVSGYLTMRGYTTRTSSGLEVVSADTDAGAEQRLADRSFFSDHRLGESMRLLDRHYKLAVIDPAAALAARLLPYADQLVLVVPASEEAPEAVAMTYEWLDGHGCAELRRRAVMVVNGVSRRSMADVEQAEAVARGRCRAIVRVPWEDGLAPGGSEVVDPGQLRAAGRRAYLALAGVVVAGFAAPPARTAKSVQARPSDEELASDPPGTRIGER